MTEKMKKSVAIIGAGSAGLVAAKNIIENDLHPTIFESSKKIGGIWAPNENKVESKIWDGLTANISKFTMKFIGHSYPKESSIFANKNDVFNYLIGYMKKFDLEKYIKYNSSVIEAQQLDNKKWSICFILNNKIFTKTYDFLIIATGLHSKPHFPLVKDQNNFKGLILHSSKFQLNDPRLKGKKVLVVGHSFSGADISQNCVDHAESVTNVFERPHLICRRFIRFKTEQNRNKINIFNLVPLDFIFFTRHIEYDINLENKQKEAAKFMNNIQCDKDKINPELYYDVKDNEQIRYTIADNYLDYVKENKILPIKSSLVSFTENGVFLNNGTFQECDVVIFSTGYTLSLDFLDAKSKELIEYDSFDYKIPYLHYKLTFNPNLENIAFICQSEGLFWTGTELQAKWISLVFSGKKKLPSKELMLKDIELVKEKRNVKIKNQYVFGEHVILCDTIARELGVLPDFEKIKQSDPELYNKLWNQCVIPDHFMLDSNAEENTMKVVEDLTNFNYIFDDNDENTDVSIKTLAKKFSVNNPLKFKINMDIFKT